MGVISRELVFITRVLPEKYSYANIVVSTHVCYSSTSRVKFSFVFILIHIPVLVFISRVLVFVTRVLSE